MIHIFDDIAAFLFLLSFLTFTINFFMHMGNIGNYNKKPFYYIYASLYFLAAGFGSFHCEEGIKNCNPIKEGILRMFAGIIISLILFYIACSYNDQLVKKINIFFKWLGKKTIPSIVTTIVVAWLCHRLGFEIPQMTIVSLTFGGVTCAINASLSKNI